METFPDVRRLASQQAGLVTRAQLSAFGVHRNAVARRFSVGVWQALSSTVVCTTTGELNERQQQWFGVLHGGDGALVAGIHAAEAAGLRNWARDELTVLVPYAGPRPAPVVGMRFVRTRRSLRDLRARDSDPPRCRLEPAVLLFAANERSERAAVGLIAACVQQGLTSPGYFRRWLEELAPLRRSALLREALRDIEGGAHSMAEIDVRRMCRNERLPLPRRQVKRRDATGRLRFTDCEWQLADGRVIVLEVDGSFHMDVEHWADDIARQRALTATGRLIVRCTAGELRDFPQDVARDLRRLGVGL